MKLSVLITLIVCLIGISETLSAQQTSSTSTSSNQTLSTQAVTLSVQTSNAGCNTNSGNIIATASGGTPPYQYKFNNEGPFNNGYYPGVSPGSYSVNVTDANGSTASATATVGNVNDAPVLTVTSFTNPTTCNSADGNFVVTASAGVAPYQYSLDMVNFSSTPSFSNLAAGFYTVMVRDAKGCIGEVRVTLTNPSLCGIPIVVTYPSPVCGSEGSVNIKYLGNDPPYENSLNGAAYASTTQYSNISPGAYTLKVRSGTGEITTLMFYVVKGCIPSTQTTVTDNTCNAANGSVTLTTVNGTLPYRYSIDGVNFQTSNTFNDLAAGKYNIATIDAAGIVVRTEAYINGGCFVVTETHNDVTCGAPDGTIELTPSGGQSPYTYSLNDGAYQSSNVFQGLRPGTYRITVKDAIGALKSISVDIKNISGLSGLTAVTAAGCLGDNVKMIASVTGGASPVEYSINDVDYQLSPEFDVVTGQSYVVYVKDGNGCKLSKAFVAPVECFQMATTVTNEDCGVNNGTLRVTTTGGTAPFEYSVDGVNFQASNIFSNLAPRAYELTIRDALTNTRAVNVQVGSNCPQVRVAVQNASCGNINGSITATGSNGAPPYQFAVNYGAFSSQSVFTDLSAGTYTIYMKDASGDIAQQQVVVANTLNPELTVTATDAFCSTGGTIKITGSGGTGALWYSIDGTNYSSNDEFTQVQSGVYQAYVTDNVGCKSSMEVEVKLDENFSFEMTPDFAICANQPGVVNVMNAKPTYTYAWSADGGSLGANTASIDIAPVQTTEYSVTVTDGLCVASASAVVTVNPLPVADAGEDIIVCYGEDARLNGSGGDSYAWSPSTYLSDANSSSPKVVFATASQQYELTVKNEFGCASLEPSSVLMTVMPPVEVYAGRDTIIAKGVPLQLNAIDVGDGGFTSYVWSPAVGLSNPFVANPVATFAIFDCLYCKSHYRKWM